MQLARMPQHPVAEGCTRAPTRGQRTVERVRGLGSKVPPAPRNAQGTSPEGHDHKKTTD